MRFFTAVIVLTLLGCGGATDASTGQQDSREVLGVDGEVRFDVREKSPVAQGTNAFHALLTTARDASALDDAVIAVEVSMPAHGHTGGGNPVVRNLGGGQYDVEGIEFTMSGTWEVMWHVRNNTVHDHHTFTYDIQ